MGEINIEFSPFQSPIKSIKGDVMVSEESLNMIAEAYSAMSDRDNWDRILTSYAQSFQHRWVNERILHPLPIEESRSRRHVLNQGHRFMAWQYHMVTLEGNLSRCEACRLDYSGHASWQHPFPSRSTVGAIQS